MTAERADIVVVGAGQAGLGSAYAAHRAGMEPVVLEAAAEPAGSWPRYYESLELFSPARYSALPGRAMPGDPERYPTRDELAAYLRDYADWLGADIRTRQRVTRVGVLGDHDFEVETEEGLLLRAPHVIAATGGFGRPHRPVLTGEETYRGAVVHTSEYRRPDGYAGSRVVVVGGGNSAVQVADELARVARTTLATRSPVRWQAQRPLGRDMHWWMDRTGLDAVPIGRLWLRLDGNPVVDDGRYRAALAAGVYDQRPMFKRFTADGVQWADGRTEPVDAVILATGTGRAWTSSPGRPRSTSRVSRSIAAACRRPSPDWATSGSSSSAASALPRSAGSGPTRAASYGGCRPGGEDGDGAHGAAARLRTCPVRVRARRRSAPRSLPPAPRRR